MSFINFLVIFCPCFYIANIAAKDPKYLTALVSNRGKSKVEKYEEVVVDDFEEMSSSEVSSIHDCSIKCLKQNSKCFSFSVEGNDDSKICKLGGEVTPGVSGLTIFVSTRSNIFYLFNNTSTFNCIFRM